MAPELAAQQVIPQLAGIVNVFVGGMLVLAILIGVGGFIEYITHLGLEQRKDGLVYMKWGVHILFVLALLLGVAQFVQGHTSLVIYGLGAAIVLLLVWFIISEMTAPAPKPEKENT